MRTLQYAVRKQSLQSGMVSVSNHSDVIYRTNNNQIIYTLKANI